jgi:large subunit ribosomal protein L21
MVKFACTGRPVLGTLVSAAEAPRRKTQQAQENQQAPWLRPCAPWGSDYGLNFNDILGGRRMYAVIRAGGKQYRVAPGDVIRVEKVGTGTDGVVEFPVLAVSGEEGQVDQQSDARVVGEVVEEGRGAKILVFHYKRKKQYKKLRGHRQAYTAVRISEIAFGGQSFKAPELPQKVAKPKKVKPAEKAPEAHEAHAPAKKASAKKKAAPKKAAKKSPKKK